MHHLRGPSAWTRCMQRVPARSGSVCVQSTVRMHACLVHSWYPCLMHPSLTYTQYIQYMRYKPALACPRVPPLTHHSPLPPAACCCTHTACVCCMAVAIGPPALAHGWHAVRRPRPAPCRVPGAAADRTPQRLQARTSRQLCHRYYRSEICACKVLFLPVM